MSKKFVCPRRKELGALVHAGFPDTDKWVEHHSGNYRVCSWCGSLAPEEFINAVKAGNEIGPTDKGYKLYVDVPGDKHTTLKFYTPHFELDRDKGEQFITLWTTAKVKWGYPGYPYVALYVPRTAVL